MAGRIPQQFIDDLLSRIDIVDIIDARVPLKKAGANHTACCPFHVENTPSFTVSQTKQFYHCFGCGAHGSAITFLMEYDHLEFPEAIENLAQTMGMEVPREGGQDFQPRDNSLYNILKSASDFYRKKLKSHQPAIEYLKKRGLSGKTAANYAIGYAADGWDNLLQVLQHEKKSSLFEAGLVIKKDNGSYYDRFRDRIMFPIRDKRGRTIGFGGRVLNDQLPKYMNSPETPTFHKGTELYGLYEVKQYAPKTDNLLVVEGYMDVVMLAEHGVSNAVATLGTATTREHLRKLFKVCNEIVFCFDGDRAGQQAAWRALENTLPELKDAYQIRFLFLPNGEDPDSLVQKEGKDAFLQRVSNATPLSEYLFTEFKQQINITSMEGRAQLVERALPLIKSVHKGHYQQLLLEELAKLSNSSETKLQQQLNSDQIEVSITQNQDKKPRTKLEMTDMRFIIAAILERPALVNQYPFPMDKLHSLEQPGVELLIQLLELLVKTPNLTTASILDRFKNTQYDTIVTKLATYNVVFSDEKTDTLATQYQETAERLIQKSDEQRYAKLIQKPLESLSAEEKELLRTFSK